jgi:hypothetical protein
MSSVILKKIMKPQLSKKIARVPKKGVKMKLSVVSLGTVSIQNRKWVKGLQEDAFLVLVLNIFSIRNICDLK